MARHFRPLAALLLLVLTSLTFTAAHMATLAEMQADVVHSMEPPIAGPTGCADGSDFKFLVRRGSGAGANRVMVDFMGGGACWGERCFDPQSVSFQTASSGIFSYLSLFEGQTTAVVNNLLANFGAQAGGGGATIGAPIGFGTDVDDVDTWTYIFVPYCTQDIHLGSCDVTYASETSSARTTVRHNGAANVRSVMDWVYQEFPPTTAGAPASLAFVGCSAGSSAVILTEAARADTFYAAQATTVVAVGDSPSNLMTEKFAREGLIKWGVGAELEHVTGWANATDHLSENILRDAMAAIFTAHPNVQFGFVTHVEDDTQLFQIQEMGGMVDGLADADAMKVWTRQNLALLEGLQTAHNNFRVYVAAGNAHCAMTFDNAMLSTGFKAWVEALLLRGTAHANAAATSSNLPAGVTCGVQCTLAGVVDCNSATGPGALEDRCGVCGGDGTFCTALPSWIPLDSCPVPPPAPETLKMSGAVRASETALLLLLAAAMAR